jgi:hypothetical protein
MMHYDPETAFDSAAWLALDEADRLATVVAITADKSAGAKCRAITPSKDAR